MKNTKLKTKFYRNLINNVPTHYRGNDYEWKALIKSLLIQPDEKSTWSKDKNGEWVRISN